MPLLDHFHAPLYPRRHWESFLLVWAHALADSLNQQLPERLFAEAYVHSCAAEEIQEIVASAESMPCVALATFEICIFNEEIGTRPIGVLVLASQGNKDRPAERRAFAVKCANYLYQGISLVLIDIVTNRQANLHNEVVRTMQNDAQFQMEPEPTLYAVAYRPVRRAGQDLALLWPTALTLGQPLPTLPLFLGEDLCLPVELETTYTEACRRLKLAV